MNNIENKYEKSFVGRKELINSFWNVYNDSSENCKIINFSGITGIGKTYLLNNLKDNLKLKDKKFVKVDIDYCTQKDLNVEKNNQNREDILLKLRNQLIDKYKFKFKRFDEVLYKYYLSIGIKEDSPEIQALLKKNSGLVGQLGDLTKDIFPQYAYLITSIRMSKIIISSFIHKLANNEKEETSKLYSLISKSFAMDLNENMENQDNKLVIFIDTYEMLIDDNLNATVSKSDKWLIEDIISSSKNILWVIAGREPIKWDNNKYKINKYEVKNLNEEESICFLKNAGIEDQDLCKKIYQKYNGMPMCLNFCVDQYWILKEENTLIDINSFGNDMMDLSNNIIRNMSIEDQEILSYLSCMNNWNDEFIIEHGSKFITCFSYIRYAKLKNKSIIIKNDKDVYSINDIVKRILYEKCDENIKNIAIKKLSDFYKNEIKKDNLELLELIDLIDNYVEYNIILEKNNDIAIENFNNILNKLDYLKLYRKFDSLDSILTKVISRFSNVTNNDVLREAYIILICILMEAGNYPKAEKYILEYEKLLKDKDSDNYTEMVELKSEILVYLHKEDEAITMLEEENRKKPDNLSILEQLALVYGRKKDKKEEAINILNGLLEKDNFNEKEKIFLSRSIANIYATMGENQKAIDIYNKLLEKTDDEIEIAYLEHDKATPLSKLGKVEKALECIEKALEIRKRRLGETHSNTLNSLNVKANILSNSGKIDEAIAIYNDIYKQKRSYFDDLDYYTIRCLINLAKAYFYKGEKNKAYDLFDKSRKLVLQSDISEKNGMLDDINSFIKKIEDVKGEEND